MDDNANNEKQMTFNSNDEEMTEEEYRNVLLDKYSETEGLMPRREFSDNEDNKPLVVAICVAPPPPAAFKDSEPLPFPVPPPL